MIQGLHLLLPELQAAFLGGDADPIQRRRRDLMPVPLERDLGRALQPPLGLHHLPGGEPLPPTIIHPEHHQLRRGLHRAEGASELLGLVAVAMDEPRQVVVGEGGLLAGDGVQGDGRLGDDLLAVAPGDLAMLQRPLGRLPPVFTPHAGRSDLVLRLQLHALVAIGAVINLRLDPKLQQPRVHMLRPALPPALQLRCRVPLARLAPEPLRPRFTRRQHHMRMRLGTAVLGAVPMHVQIRHHASVHELPLHELRGQLDAILAAHLSGDGELHLPRQLGVLTLLDRLHLVPQHLAVAPALRRVVGQHHFAVDHIALGGEVLRPPQPLVLQPRCRTIRRRGHRARSVGTADDLGAEVVDRHRASPTDARGAAAGAAWCTPAAIRQRSSGSATSMPTLPQPGASFKRRRHDV